MGNKTIIGVLFSAAAIVVGCLLCFWDRVFVPDPTITWASESCCLTQYVSGRPKTSISLAVNSPLVLRIDEIINGKRGAWRRSFYTYAPGVLIESDSFKVNVLKSLIVVNHKNTAGNWSQIVCDLSEAEFSDLSGVFAECLDGKTRK
jgi:hypothetical protein